MRSKYFTIKKLNGDHGLAFSCNGNKNFSVSFVRMSLYCFNGKSGFGFSKHSFYKKLNGNFFYYIYTTHKYGDFFK